MKRRGFLKKIPIMASAPMMLNGVPFSVMAGNNQLKQLAMEGAFEDRVIVLIQLHGGNDGLNSVIPVDQYARYVGLRPNMAIPPIDSGSTRRAIALDNTLSIEDQVALHPDMVGMKALYDEGKMAIVQGVGYENINQSHFRSRDIWYMGGDYDEFLGSGWAGRYLEHEFPTYPEDETILDPPGLELGRSVNLLYHTDNGIPAALAIDNPGQFFGLAQDVLQGLLPEEVRDSHYYKELEWILGIQDKANDYAERLFNLYQSGIQGEPNTDYPTRYPFDAPDRFRTIRLGEQLKTIARLLSGGIRTKIFLARMGGFDTHASQVEASDATMGAHAALLYQLSASVKAFQDDLKKRGLADRVLTVTFSEFGRRAESNGSYGTDHGTVAPMFVFGEGVKPGVIGGNPDLSNLNRGNLVGNIDYRQVFTTVLQDWMGASGSAISATMFQDFQDQRLDLIGTVTGTKDAFIKKRFRLDDCYPNPAKGKVTISFYIDNGAHVKLNIYDNSGRLVKEVLNQRKEYGEYKVEVDLEQFQTGTYLYTIEAGNLKDTKQMVVVK